jgi:hypothetical protein
MEKKENPPFLLYFSLYVTAIFLTILLLATSTIFIALGLINQNQIAIAQQQQEELQELQNNQTSSVSSLTKQPLGYWDKTSSCVNSLYKIEEMSDI